MGKVATGTPQQGYGPRHQAGQPKRRTAAPWQGFARGGEMHVVMQGHAHDRPEIEIAAAPFRHRKIALYLRDQGAIALDMVGHARVRAKCRRSSAIAAAGSGPRESCQHPCPANARTIDAM